MQSVTDICDNCAITQNTQTCSPELKTVCFELDTVTDLSKKLNEIARGRIRNDREEYAQIIRAKDAEIQEYAQTIRAKDAEIINLKQEYAQLQGHIVTLTQEILAKDDEIINLRQQFTKRDAKNAQITSLVNNLLSVLNS